MAGAWANARRRPLLDPMQSRTVQPSDESELVSTKAVLSEEMRIVDLLARSGAILTSPLDVQHMLQSLTDVATQLCRAQFGMFCTTAAGAQVESSSSPDLAHDQLETYTRFIRQRGGAIFGATVRGEGVTRIGDIDTDPRFGSVAAEERTSADLPPVRSYLAVPVVARSGEVLGGLFFGHEAPDVFTERAERLIAGIAAQVAIAVDYARIYEEAQRMIEERARLGDAEWAVRAEAQRIDLVRDEFLGTLSHELRTPLSVVLGWSEVLLSRTTEVDAEFRLGLEAIARNARAQAQLLDDLLDMNRLASGQLRLDVQRVGLAAIVDAAVGSVQQSANAKSITLRSAIDPNAAPILGDPLRLQQVVRNLLSNAVKFTPQRGSIDIVVKDLGSHIELSVQDSGIGVRPEFLPHLFERFRQAESSTARKYKGLGVGLALVKELAELHGGTVHATSAGEGMGATFVVNLPACSQADAASAREHAVHSAPPSMPGPVLSLAGVKVLVIDDEPDVRELMRLVLINAGAEVLTASSSDAGFASVRAHRPDVIVSDIGMPERDGYQFIRDLRSLDETEAGGTPAVALTAFTTSEDRMRALHAGFQVHMCKPINPKELITTVRGLALDRVAR